MSPIRSGVAGGLVALVLLGCVTGLGRYLSEREHQGVQLAELLGHAQGLALKGSGIDAEAARVLITQGVDAVDVVQAGTVDAFGIERGARLTVSEKARGGSSSELSKLQTRMAAFAALQQTDAPAALRYAAMERPNVSGLRLSAYAPVQSPDGAVVGLVRVEAAQTAGDDPIPWWALLMGLVLSCGLGALSGGQGAKRPGLVYAAGLACIVCGLALGRGVTFGAWAAVTLFPVAWLSFRPVDDLLRGLKEQPATYFYVLPAVLATLILVFIPFCMGVVLAFFDAQGAPVGLDNFREILVASETSDTNFWWTLGMTVIWTVTNITLHVSIGLALALVLNRPKLEFRWLYRVLLIVPWAVPNYITALIWKGMFNEHEGAVNALLAVFGVGAIDWFGTSVLTNFTANLVTNVWLGFPFMMVVCLGALQAIPRELYEAATIDGAGRLQAFRHVTLPLLKPALVPAIIVGTIWTFNMFNVIYLVSGGGPDGQTDILITEAYNAFKVLKRYGLAAAYSLLIFVILYAYGAMTNRITRAAEGAFE